MRKLVAIIAVLLSLISFSGCSSEIDYESAKKGAENFLTSNRAELEATALQAIRDGKLSASEFEDVSYISFDLSNHTVTFEIGAQGMRGGQYWSLVYSEDGTYQGESERYTWHESEGNNMILAEHLQGNWFFLWMDYDGREDLSKIK